MFQKAAATLLPSPTGRLHPPKGALRGAEASVPITLSGSRRQMFALVSHFLGQVYIPVAVPWFHTVFNPMGLSNYFIVSYIS